MAKYSFEFKNKVTLEYIQGKGSYSHLASKHGMSSSSPLKRWVKAYENQGDNGLMRSRKNETYSFDFKLYVVESKNSNHSITNTTDINSEYFRQLEEENLKLRIENAYLKELRRLRFEGTPQNRKRELSTASEDHSN